MKALEEKRDKLIDKLCVSSDVSMIKGFNLGWDACVKEYEKENAELKRKLEIAEKDFQRLEWLIDNNYVVSCGINTFWVSEVDGQYRLGPKFLTARDAIDECMKFIP